MIVKLKAFCCQASCCLRPEFKKKHVIGKMARFSADVSNNGRDLPINADVEDMFELVGSGSLVSARRSGGGAAMDVGRSALQNGSFLFACVQQTGASSEGNGGTEHPARVE